ncbi:MAG TPA: Rid family hydrolase, partial [Planctomycetota bacterium]|nr:Rid family hydrolase [Planctomycetota bacterium]
MASGGPSPYPEMFDGLSARWFRARETTECHLHAAPLERDGDCVESQTAAIYARLGEFLEKHRASPSDVVWEQVFLRDVGNDRSGFEAARGIAIDRMTEAARSRDAGARGMPGVPAHLRYEPATSCLGQPPLATRHRVEALFRIHVSDAPRPPSRRVIAGASMCGCEPCDSVQATMLALPASAQIISGQVYGPPGDALSEAYGMFCAADELLARSGVRFADVVRTWIWLRRMGRDYDALNRARSLFFAEREIRQFPASTGIGAAPIPDEHDLALAFIAVKGPSNVVRKEVMSASTLNEAPAYGSAFSRGLAVADGEKVTLHISGTASVDEHGRSVHPGDLEAQIDRTLQNIEALLRGRGASFDDVVSAITYLKHAKDTSRLQAKLDEHGIAGKFPNVLVE